MVIVDGWSRYNEPLWANISRFPMASLVGGGDTCQTDMSRLLKLYIPSQEGGRGHGFEFAARATTTGFGFGFGESKT